MDMVKVFTDGASRGNPGRAGWAWVVDSHSWQAGSIAHATSIVAEVTAATRALQAIPERVPVTIYSDAEFVRKSAGWVDAWARSGWKKRDGSPVANLALMRDFHAAIHARTPRPVFEWVKGHAGVRGNEAADRLATQAADRGQAASGAAQVAGPGWVR